MKMIERDEAIAQLNERRIKSVKIRFEDDESLSNVLGHCQRLGFQHFTDYIRNLIYLDLTQNQVENVLNREISGKRFHEIPFSEVSDRTGLEMTYLMDKVWKKE